MKTVKTLFNWNFCENSKLNIKFVVKLRLNCLIYVIELNSKYQIALKIISREFKRILREFGRE